MPYHADAFFTGRHIIFSGVPELRFGETVVPEPSQVVPDGVGISGMSGVALQAGTIALRRSARCGVSFFFGRVDFVFEVIDPLFQSLYASGHRLRCLFGHTAFNHLTGFDAKNDSRSVGESEISGHARESAQKANFS